MSELNEQRWGVMSERGCEAMHVAYAAAADLVRRLRSEGIRGLCVISAEAASHLQPVKTAADASSANIQPIRQRRAAKK